jgi:hypothetical protein
VSTSSAIPDDMYSYSDQVCSANDDLATWTRTVLAPAITRYRDTAIDYGGTIYGITLTVMAEGTPTGLLDGDVQTMLGQLHSTDGDVRTVGEAFAFADGGRSTDQVTLDDPSLDAYYASAVQVDSDSARAGKEAADRLVGYGSLGNDIIVDTPDGGSTHLDTVQWLMDVLSSERDNPAFLAAFFNELAASPQGQTLLTAIMGYAVGNTTGFASPGLSGVPAESGSLSGDDRCRDLLTSVLVDIFGTDLLTPSTRTFLSTAAVFDQGLAVLRWGVGNFFTALSKDPTAAANFFLSLPPGFLAQLTFPGDAAGDETMGALLYAARAAMTGTNAASASEIYDMMTATVTRFHTLDPGADAEAIASFLGAYTAVTISSPPADGDPEHLRTWAARAGKTFNDALQPYLTWLAAVEARDSTYQSTSISFVTGVVTTVLGAWFPPAGGIMFGLATTMFTTYIQPAIEQDLNITGWNTVADTSHLHDTCAALAKTVVLLRLMQEHMLVGPDGKVLDPSDPAASDTLKTLCQFGTDANALTGWHVKGTGELLGDALANAGDQFSGAGNAVSD